MAEKQMPHLELIKAFTKLGELHKAFNGAAQELEQARAAPLCLEECGKCCHLPYAWDIEGRYILSTILGDGHLSRIESLCEGWLLDRPRQLTLYNLYPGRIENYAIREEIAWLMQSPCPFLDNSNKRCIIYNSRPISCRAYGVTRMPSKECPRPMGIGESESRKAYFGGEGGMKLQARVAKFIQGLASPWNKSWALPALLYSLINPVKFNLYAKDKKVASAKLAVGWLSPAILWQSQLNELWRKAETV